jgi:hypothetical protein
MQLTLSEAPENLVLYISSESPIPFEIAAIAGKKIIFRNALGCIFMSEISITYEVHSGL